MHSPSQIRISPKGLVRVLLACMIGQALAGIVTQIGIRFTDAYVVGGLARNFDLSGEGTVPAWFSAICLFCCAAALVTIGWTKQRERDPFRVHWLGMAAVFAAMSMDESISLHEAFVAPLRNAFGLGGFFYYSWVIPGAAFVLVFCLFTRRFVLHLPRKARWEFCRAGAIYCSGALGMEMLSAKVLSDGLTSDSPLYVALSFTEESLEMLGAILFLGALLDYAREHVGALTIGWDPREVEASGQNNVRTAAAGAGSIR